MNDISTNDLARMAITDRLDLWRATRDEHKLAVYIGFELPCPHGACDICDLLTVETRTAHYSSWRLKP